MSDAAQSPDGLETRKLRNPTVEDAPAEENQEPAPSPLEPDNAQSAEEAQKPSRSRPRHGRPAAEEQASATLTPYREDEGPALSQEEIASQNGAVFCDNNSSFYFSFGDHTVEQNLGMMSAISALSAGGVSAFDIATIVTRCGYGPVTGIGSVSDLSHDQSSNSTT
jgi:hypothetical protein